MWEIILSAILAMVVGGATSAINNASAKKREEEARAENYKYNELAAGNADLRGRQFFTDIQSPKAQVQQLEEAGLSPSLFYSGGNAGGGTASTGAMGAGANGLLGQSFGMGTPRDLAELQLLQAQKEKTKAETQKVEEETKTESGTNAKGIAQIQQMLADKGAKDAAACLAKAQETQQELLTYITDRKKEFDIGYAEHLLDKIQYESNSAYYDMKQKGIQLEIAEDTKEEVKKQERLKNAKILSELTINQSQVELNQAQQEQIYNDISLAWEQLENETEKIAVSKEEVKVKREQIAESQRQFDARLETIWKDLRIKNYVAVKTFSKKITRQQKHYGNNYSFITADISQETWE